MSQIGKNNQGPEALNDSFGKTYAWLENDNCRIIGFYNISAGSIDYLDNDSVYKMGGAVHINDFAIAQEYQGVEVASGINMSDILLDECIKKYTLGNWMQTHVYCNGYTITRGTGCVWFSFLYNNQKFNHKRHGSINRKR